MHCMVRQIPGLSLLFQPLDVINLISNHALNSLLGHFFHSKDIYDRKFSGSNFCFLHLIAFFYLMSIDKKKGCQILTKIKFPTHTYETLEHVVLSQPSNRKLKKEPFSFSRSCIFKSQRQSSGGSPQSLNSNSILKSIQYFPHAFFPQHLLFQITTLGNSLVPPR